ncbi:MULTISPECIES: SDR family oxidoreductase [unclassified Legionella]|uniref:SDR family oxidoreductase n=1 Tax=unclassified Legionella TaxID=2622702 RepID=UPI001E49CFA5|nr:SDR family oxidoreductase [Legionella sp. 31fI33]MCC5013983.1 SDR family oxidoreductase [Legionella sp. 31fI33]
MHHLIIGYGYCGYHLAQYLLNRQQTVTAISRHLDESMNLPGLQHITHDINKPFLWQEKNTVLYYLIPPASEGEQDNILQTFLSLSSIQPAKIIYFGSSGVYGNHQGNWVNEQSSCNLDHPRQHRRLNAEQQWLAFCKQQQIPCVLFRVAGIYGPNRLPLQAAMAQKPLLAPREAPYTNHIYVHDLSEIAYQFAEKIELSGIYNIADGKPDLLGTLQQQVAQALGLEAAPYEPWEQIWALASPMKREFMLASKRLSIDALRATLKETLKLTSLSEAVINSLKEEGNFS